MPVDLEEKPEIIYWLDGTTECWATTLAYRRNLMLHYSECFGLFRFIETGTHRGDTVEVLRGHFEKVYSIEHAAEFFAHASQRLRHAPNVKLIYGDSGVELRRLLSQLTRRPTLFWLDAHGTGEHGTGGIAPLREELEAIFDSGIPGVVLVDDMQDFWKNGLPELAAQVVAEHPPWQQEIKHGIMRVVKP